MAHLNLIYTHTYDFYLYKDYVDVICLVIVIF